MALNLGVEARVLVKGRLDATGRAVVRVLAEFPEGVTRLHLQAVTAPTAGFETLAATPGKVVRDPRSWLAESPVTGSRAGPDLSTWLDTEGYSILVQLCGAFGARSNGVREAC